MNLLSETDHSIFELINEKWHSSWLDSLMPVVRNAQTWIPFYLFLLLWVMMNYRSGRWWWLVFAALVPALGDLISSGLIKHLIYRTRPCNNPDLSDHVRFLLSYRPQSSSFTSSHATNHFAMATFFFMTLKERMPKASYLFFIWAALIGYAQVYVGVHYPFDVLAGAGIGIFLGYLASRTFKHFFELI